MIGWYNYLLCCYYYQPNQICSALISLIMLVIALLSEVFAKFSSLEKVIGMPKRLIDIFVVMASIIVCLMMVFSYQLQLSLSL